MINREWRDATVVTFTSAVDDYGQKKMTQTSARNIRVVLKDYAKNNVTDPRFVDVEMVALTKDRDITTSDRLYVGSVAYDVLYTLPGRLEQIFLRRRP